MKKKYQIEVFNSHGASLVIMELDEVEHQVISKLCDEVTEKREFSHEPMMTIAPLNYAVGDFVRYIAKNEIGLVGEVMDNDHVRCWWHMGGTRATIATFLIEPLSDYQVKNEVFSNDYAKKSLQARRVILLQGGDVSDLIYV